jgi:hypothetical protein
MYYVYEKVKMDIHYVPQVWKYVLTLHTSAIIMFIYWGQNLTAVVKNLHCETVRIYITA